MSDLVERLDDDMRQLAKMVVQARLAGPETGVRVKDPALLLADLTEAASRISQQDAELDRMRREVEEFKALFEQRWNTDLRAKKRWQDANPDKPNIWPSRDDLLVWLMDQHDEARKAAFIEAAEIAEKVAAGQDQEWRTDTAMRVAYAIRAKAEGENHG